MNRTFSRLAEQISPKLLAAPRKTSQSESGNLVTVPSQETFSARSRSTRIAVRSKEKTFIIDSQEIIAAEAKGNSVVLRLMSGSVAVRESLHRITEKLTACGFVRIHRSYVINAIAVMEILPLSTGEYLLKTKDGGRYTVSRTYKANLRSLADFSLGCSKVITK